MGFKKAILLLALFLRAFTQLGSAGPQAKPLTPVQAYFLEARDPEVVKKAMKELKWFTRESDIRSSVMMLL